MVKIYLNVKRVMILLSEASMRHFILTIIVFIFSTTVVTSYGAQRQQSWNSWVQDLRAEAIQDGIDPALFDRLFADIRPNKKTLHLDRTQPERRITFVKYRNTRGDAYRIKLGQKKYKKHRAKLEEIGNAYGVNPCMISALWGIESSYGHYMGNFPVIRSLATLAYDKRRGDFFRKELIYALHILNDNHVDIDKFKGEWAGASGHPQFLPSSWHKFAVDYDQDGYKDIWTNLDDVFASIANYLVKNGWESGEPWYIEVDVPYGFDQSLLGKETKMPISQWYQQGVYPASGFAFPEHDLQASIIKPYGGPYLMTFNNFNTIMRYNNSTFYAGTVGYVASEICKGI